MNVGSVRCAPGEPGSGIWSITAGAYREPDTGKGGCGGMLCVLGEAPAVIGTRLLCVDA